VKPTTSRQGYHRGFGFEVWTRSSAWFWRLIDPGRNGGTIGAAGNEAEAVQEACATIEGITGRAGGFASLEGSRSPPRGSIVDPHTMEPLLNSCESKRARGKSTTICPPRPATC
jgi:hypothetical protein